MTLLEARQDFVAKTGRTDLIKGDGSADIGVNNYINAGIRYLDVLQDTPDTKRGYVKDIAAAGYTMDIQYLRSIERVQVTDTNEKVYKLLPEDLEYIKDMYSTSNLRAQNVPLYYALNINKLAPTQTDKTSSTFTDGTYGLGDIKYGTFSTYRGIIWMPPSDGVYTMKVYGRFYTERVSADSDTNFWLTEYPDLVIQAAMMKLEMDYRNSEGVRDYVNAIRIGLQPLDYQQIEEEMGGDSVMRESRL